MKTKLFSLLFVLILALTLTVPVLADAVIFPDDTWPVDYYVYVTTPDGGLNLREGPGVDYPIILTIPDYEQLHVFQEKSNGWGFVQYGDNFGWVFLGQTSDTLPATPEPTPEPTPELAPELAPESMPEPAAEPTSAPTEQPAVVITPPAQKSPADSSPPETPAPSNSSALSTSTILITALCGIVIILAAIVIYLVLRKK